MAGDVRTKERVHGRNVVNVDLCAAQAVRLSDAERRGNGLGAMHAAVGNITKLGGESAHLRGWEPV